MVIFTESGRSPHIGSSRRPMAGRRLRLLSAALFVTGAATGIAGLHAADEAPTAFVSHAPVINFELATFTPQGYREWLLRGDQGQYLSQDELRISGLNLTIFAKDAANHIDSIFLSPEATASPTAGRVHGAGPLRLITDDFEATGEDWSYDRREKKVSIRKNVRVVFHAALTSILR